MRYIEQLNILITGSVLNNNITIWNVPDFNEIGKNTTEHYVARVEIMNKSNDIVQIITGGSTGQINIWNVKKIKKNKFSIELLTSF